MSIIIGVQFQYFFFWKSQKEAISLLSVVFLTPIGIAFIWFFLIRVGIIEPTFPWCQRFVTTPEHINETTSILKQIQVDNNMADTSIRVQVIQENLDKVNLSAEEFHKKYGYYK